MPKITRDADDVLADPKFDPDVMVLMWDLWHDSDCRTRLIKRPEIMMHLFETGSDRTIKAAVKSLSVKDVKVLRELDGVEVWKQPRDHQRGYYAQMCVLLKTKVITIQHDDRRYGTWDIKQIGITNVGYAKRAQEIRETYERL